MRTELTWPHTDFINKIPLLICFTVNVGDYIEAVLDRNLAENISRVLYPNDNVSLFFSIVQVISDRPITSSFSLILLEIRLL